MFRAGGSPAEIGPERQMAEWEIEVSDCLEGLLLELKKESERLRARGLPVDERCRINPESFKGVVYKSEDVARDKSVIEGKKKVFDADTKTGDALGEILEAATTVAFNKFWFDGRLIKVRTSEFDDILKNIDQLIIDSKTLEIIAATDTTISPHLKSSSISRNIKRGGEVKYGIKMDRDGIHKGTLSRLPYFIISIDARELVSLSESLISGRKDDPRIKKWEIKTLNRLIEETRVFAEMADRDQREKYTRAREIFQQIILERTEGPIH